MRFNTIEDRQEATVVPNAIAIESYDGQHGFISVSVPDDYADVKKINRKVLTFNGETFVFTGWDSDKHLAYFRTSDQFATIARKS